MTGLMSKDITATKAEQVVSLTQNDDCWSKIARDFLDLTILNPLTELKRVSRKSNIHSSIRLKME
jgi:hypothetical protein